MRLVLADSRTLVLAGFKRLIEEHTDAAVVGEARDGQSLLELVGQLRPDAVLTEIDLPKISGLEALVQIHRHYPEVAVLVLTGLTDGQHVPRPS